MKNPPPIKRSNKGVPQIQLLNAIINSPKCDIIFNFKLDIAKSPSYTLKNQLQKPG
jgi:hypothetical protein